MTSITINGITIDPGAPKAMLASMSLDNLNAKSSDYLVVQTKTPLDKAQRAKLADAGAEILEAVPGGAFICHFPGTSLVKVRALDFVEWAEVYPEAVKLAPSLLRLNAQPGGVGISSAKLAAPESKDDTRVTVDVVVHRNVNIKTAAKKIAAAAHLNDDEVRVSSGKVRLRLKERRLGDVAKLDVVRSLERVEERKLSNNIARQVLRVPAGAATTVPDGTGEVIAIADTGFDMGSTTNVHPAFKGRVKKLYALGRPGRKDDPDGHGTHVAGSALGDGVSKTDGAIRGAAPGAKLVLQSLLDSGGGLGGLPDDLHDLFAKPYTTDKARVHSNSWGSNGSFGVYDAQAHELDDFVYTHRDMLILFAAGNEGRDGDANGQIDPGSVTPPGTAKNCLTIGACENNRPTQTLTYGQGWPRDFSANPIKSDRVANNPDGMVAFSSRGPTHDERIKPDVVAPGTYILSSRSRATKSEGWGVSGDPLYMFDGGTSMATPLVAGCVAVVRSFLKSTYKLTKPSAALVKALIINGARDMSGQYVPTESGITPNNSEGFGRVDVQAVTGPYGAHESITFFDEAKKLDTNQREDRTFTAPAGAHNLKVTLVWTDPPGEGLQSDLDLIVKVGTQQRHGNMAAGASGFDRKNNVEQVQWTAIPTGPVTVSVVAFSIAIAPQSYALVVRWS